MMSEQTDTFSNLLTPYGLSSDESRVYLFLLSHPGSTALAISRDLKIGRTKVYRCLDKLKEKQLALFQLDSRGLRFNATNPGKLEQLVNDKIKEAESLKHSLPSLVQQLTKLTNTTSGKGSKVLYYTGIDGLEQVSWNALQAKDTIRVFEKEHISDFLSQDFSEKFRAEQVKRGITTLDLTNKPTFDGFTDVEELINSFSLFRYIDPAKLRIEFEVLIYNDVYATYTYHGSEVFCIEVYNEQLAAMQTQLFDFIWNVAVPMKFTDKRGAASI